MDTVRTAYELVKVYLYTYNNHNYYNYESSYCLDSYVSLLARNSKFIKDEKKNPIRGF